jgi:serine/threonine protein kinase
VAHARLGDPARIGPYAVRARLGGGPTGQVYRGVGPGGGQLVIKVFHDHLMAVPGFRAVLAGEVATARAVGRRRVIPVVDADLYGEPAWVARSHVPGRTLEAEVARREMLTAPEVAWLGRGLAEGLAALHDAGIVHRDLKPSNIILTRHGPRITDFGTSSAVAAQAATGGRRMLGAPEFIAPEHARAGQAGPPSDIFSLGAVLAYAARGIAPFGQPGQAPLRHKAARAAPDLAGIPGELRPVIEQCLSPDHALRPTARQVRSLLTYTEITPARPRPVARPARLKQVADGEPVADGDLAASRVSADSPAPEAAPALMTTPASVPIVVPPERQRARRGMRWRGLLRFIRKAAGLAGRKDQR